MPRTQIVLTCPKCGQSGLNSNRSRLFSPVQKEFGQVVIFNCNVNFNCCSKCSPNKYYLPPVADAPATGQSSTSAERIATSCTARRFPVREYAQQVTPIQFDEALFVVRTSLRHNFWNVFHDTVCQSSQMDQYREMLRSIARTWGISTAASGLKLMSHFGAVKAHIGVPDHNVRAYDDSGLAYHDPGNEIYKFVVMEWWPETNTVAKQEKVGDVVEAFLGLRWFIENPEIITSHDHWLIFRGFVDNVLAARDHNRRLLDVMDALDKVIAYVYDHWQLFQRWYR